MNEKIELSVVVPFYNVEKYFGQFLDSLLPLSSKYEVILVNDGSKDSSREIALTNARKYKNIILLEQENKGQSAARNYGMSFARGEYIIFFDSDDLIEDRLVLEHMLNLGRDRQADVVAAPYYEFRDLKKKKYRFDKTDFVEDLITIEDRLDLIFLNKLSFAVWNKIFRLKFLLENKLKFKEGILFEDLDFIFRANFHAKRISKCNMVLLGYRQRSGSIMTTITHKILDKIWVLEELQVFLEKNDKQNRFIERFKVLYLRMAFSVIYSVVKGQADYKEKKNVLNILFETKSFTTILENPVKANHYLSKKELVFYRLLRYNIITPERLLLLNRFFNIV